LYCLRLDVALIVSLVFTHHRHSYLRVHNVATADPSTSVFVGVSFAISFSRYKRNSTNCTTSGLLTQSIASLSHQPASSPTRLGSLKTKHCRE